MDAEVLPASTPGGITPKADQVILSYCGYTAGAMIAEQPTGTIECVIIHFNKDLLERIFKGTKPTLWEELQTPVSQYVVEFAANALVKFYLTGSLTLLKIKLP